MTKTLKQSEARTSSQASGWSGANCAPWSRGQHGQDSEVSSSWRREGRLCEGCGHELDLEGGGAARGRLGSAEKGEKTPFSLFPGHQLTFRAWIIV